MDNVPTATVSSDGRITIPVSVRQALGLQPGDRLLFVTLPDGSFQLSRETHSVRTLKGFFGPPSGPAVSVEEMSTAIADEAVENYR